MALDKVSKINPVALPREQIPVASVVPTRARPDTFVKGFQGINAPAASRLGGPLWSGGATGAGNNIVTSAATSTMTSLENRRAKFVELFQEMIQNVG